MPRVPESPSRAEHKSKSQRKREADSLQKLGEKLVTLSPAELAKIPLEPDLREAVEQARAMRSHSARRRQLRFVGKCLRACDGEVVRRALEQLDSQRNVLLRRLHEVEHWRDRLVAGDKEALAELLARYPRADGQRLRQLAREARKELTLGRPPAAARKLFRYVRDIIADPDPETGGGAGI